MTRNTASYIIRDHKIEPGAFVHIAAPGDFVTALRASADFKLSFDDGPKNDFEHGLTVAPTVPFRKVTVHNQKALSITVRLGIGRGDFVDSRFIPVAPIATEPLAPDTFETPGPVTIAAGATHTIAGDTSRTDIAVQNLSLTDELWLQDTSTTGAAGWPLRPQAGVVLSTAAGLQVHNPGAAAIQLAVFEIKRGA